MKKLLYVLILVLVVTITPSIFAYEIKTLDVTEDTTGLIKVSGTSESEMMAASISIFDEAGTTLITMKTVQVNDDDTFSAEFQLDPGKYVVRAADYDGGTVVEKTVVATDTTNVKTGDNIYTYVIIGAIAVIAIIAGVLYIRKNSNN